MRSLDLGGKKNFVSIVAVRNTQMANHSKHRVSVLCSLNLTKEINDKLNLVRIALI